MNSRKTILFLIVLLLLPLCLTSCARAEFKALVVRVSGDSVLVIPEAGSPPTGSADLISFSAAGLGLALSVGQIISVEYDGAVMESYPGQIRASGVKIIGEAGALPIEKLTEMIWAPPANSEDAKLTFGLGGRFSTISETGPVYYGQYRIEQITGGAPGEVALIIEGIGNTNKDYNGTHSARIIEYNDTQYLFFGDKFYYAAEESAGVGESTGYVVDKPVIYLYPTEPTNVFVRLFFDGQLTATIPEYPAGGWDVLAQPDGTIISPDGISYPYLFWEGMPNHLLEITQGFCVAGEDTESFLREKLAQLGLIFGEAEDFVEFWLPRMEGSAYNLIQFQTDAYTDMARLEITPAPDSLLRVFMTYKPSDVYTEIPEQELAGFERRGFAVVEWGGCELPASAND